MPHSPATESLPSLHLYSARTCPFAQRTRLVLQTKGLAFELIEIDLDHPPADFRTISPYGKVPLLECEGDRIWESSVINEYIEERFPQPPLMPGGPAARAKARIWIDYANNVFVPLFYKLLLLQKAEEQQAIADRLRESLLFLEDQALVHARPYWLGPEVSLVDYTYYPFFERFPVLEHFRRFSIPEQCPRLHRWLGAMKVLPAVSALAPPLELYLERYARYADASVNNDTAREMLEK